MAIHTTVRSSASWASHEWCNFTGRIQTACGRFASMDSTTPVTLIQRVRDTRDAQSWREFVDLYEPLLLRYARKHGLDENDARDAVQETFIRLLRVLPGFQLDHTRGRFRSWLWRIFMSAVIDIKRREKRRGKGESGYVRPEPPPESQEWIQDYHRHVMTQVLAKVKEATQPKTWHCFEQHILKCRPGTEIAGEVDLTPNAVCVNAARVLRKVRTLSREYMEDLDDAHDSLS